MESPYQVVKIEEYGTRGVVFPDSVSFPQPGLRYPDNFYERYTPSGSEVKQFEIIFHEKFDVFFKKWPNYNPNWNLTAERFKSYPRQYFGYVDDENQRYFLIILKGEISKYGRDRWYKTPYRSTSDWVLFCNIKTGEMFY